MSDLLSRNVLVINQKAKLIELTNEYAILDENGNQVGVIREEGQSKAKKLLRFVSNLDQFMTHTLSVYDAGGQKVVELVRPRKILKSSLQISDGSGQAVGAIVQQNVVGKKRFSLQGPGGVSLGSINAENWRSWDFSIQNAEGQEVGRITKKWAGVLKEAFTTADDYLLSVTADVPPELRLMMLASAAGIDTALKQDDSGGVGFGGFGA